MRSNAWQRVKAIRNTKNFAPLAASFKRIRNILEKSAGGNDKVQLAVNTELLWEPAERNCTSPRNKIGEEATRREEGEEVSRGARRDFRAAAGSGFLLRQSSSDG